MLLTTLAAEGKQTFTTADAHRVLAGSRAATYKLLHDLVRSGWLQPLCKGEYLIIPLEAGPRRRYTLHSLVIASRLAPDGYIAYWTALHHHGLTEQIPRTVWVVAQRRLQNRSIAGVPYRFVTLRPHKMFGQQRVWIESQPVVVSDQAKTIVDALDNPTYSGGIIEVAKALSIALTEERVNLDILTEYARKMRNGAILKRLGYLGQLLGLPTETYAGQWSEMLTAGYAMLDPGRPDWGPRNRRWRVRCNVTEQEFSGLLEE